MSIISFRSQENNPHSFTVKFDDKNFKLEQKVDQYRRYAAQSRAAYAQSTPPSHYKSFAIIPDIVAIDILTKYGIDIHSDSFMHDTEMKRKVEQIIVSEYPDLLTSNIRS